MLIRRSAIRLAGRRQPRRDRVLRDAAERLLGRDDLTDEEREQLGGALHALDACEHHEWLMVVPVEYLTMLGEAERAILPVWERHTGAPM